MSRLSFVALNAFIFCLSLGAQAQPKFNFRVYLPNSADCKVEAQKIAQRFASETQLKVLGHSCQEFSNVEIPDFKGNIASIIYTADQEFVGNPVIIGGSPYSPTGMDSTSDSTAAYDTYATCLADIPNQTLLFEKNLQVKPISADCLPDSVGDSKFVLKINAVSESLTHIHVFQSFQGLPSSETMAKVTALVTTSGGRIAHVYQNKIYFYDESNSTLGGPPTQVLLTASYVVISRGLAECKLQLAVAQKILQTAADTSSVVACIQADNEASLQIVSFGYPAWNFDPIGAGLGYGSYSECESDRARVVDNARLRSDSVRGGVCGFAGGGPNHDYNVILGTR